MTGEVYRKFYKYADVIAKTHIQMPEIRNKIGNFIIAVISINW